MVVLLASYLNKNWKLVGLYFKNKVDEQITDLLYFLDSREFALLLFKGVFFNEV